MTESFREAFVEIDDATTTRRPHIQPLDMLRMAAAGELVGLPHTLHGHLLLDLDMDEPVEVLEVAWTHHAGERHSAVWGLALLEGETAPVAVHWHGPTDLYDAAVFEVDTVVIASTVDLLGLVEAFEAAAFDDLLADAP